MNPVMSSTTGSDIRSLADWAAPSASARPRTRMERAFEAIDTRTRAPSSPARPAEAASS